MKRQIIMATISLYSLTWAMDHKTDQPYFAKSKVYPEPVEGKGKQQPDHLKPIFSSTTPQSMEREQEANLLLPKLANHTTRNTTSLHKTSLFIVHPDRAKL
jgi:hypothetical protein